MLEALEVVPNGHASALNALEAALAGLDLELLVFDHAEALTAELATLVIEIRRVAPSTTVIVASRIALDVAGEQVLTVEPLTLPRAEGVEPAALLDSGAVQLLLDALDLRAADGVPREPTTSELECLAALARSVDGNPFALQLCAARARWIGVEATRAAVDESLLDATGDAPPGSRFSNLRSAIAWSWQLLAEDGQRDLARLSAVEGAFDLRCAAALLRVGAAVVAQRVEALRRVSLVSVALPAGTFRLPRMVRELARERSNPDDLEHADRALSAFVLGEVEQALESDELLRLDVVLSDDRLAQLYRIARRAEALGDERARARAFVALGPHLVRAGCEPALRLRLEACWHALSSEHERERARIAALLLLLLLNDDTHEAIRWARSATRAAEDSRDDGLLLAARAHLALALAGTGQADEAAMVLGPEPTWPASSEAVRVGARWMRGCVLLYDGRYEEAIELLERALAGQYALGRPPGPFAIFLGSALLRSGQYERARPVAVAICEDDSVPSSHRVAALCDLTLIDAARGDHTAAATRVDAAIALARRAGTRGMLGRTLRIRADLALARGERDEASAREALSLLTHACAAEERDLAMLSLAATVTSQAEALSLLESARARLAEHAVAAPRVALWCALIALRWSSAEARDERLVDAEVLLARHDAAPRGSRTLLASLSLRHEVDAHRSVSSPPPSFPRFARDGAWFQLGAGEPVVTLQRRTQLRRLLAVLVAHHPGEPLDSDEIFARAWEGERASRGAARSRVYTTLFRLRKLGLDDLVVRRNGGFLLDPRRAISIE